MYQLTAQDFQDIFMLSASLFRHSCPQPLDLLKVFVRVCLQHLERQLKQLSGVLQYTSIIHSVRSFIPFNFLFLSESVVLCK